MRAVEQNIATRLEALLSSSDTLKLDGAVLASRRKTARRTRLRASNIGAGGRSAWSAGPDDPRPGSRDSTSTGGGEEREREADLVSPMRPGRRRGGARDARPDSVGPGSASARRSGPANDASLRRPYQSEAEFDFPHINLDDDDEGGGGSGPGPRPRSSPDPQDKYKPLFPQWTDELPVFIHRNHY